MRVGLYARVSTQDQQTLALQREAMEAYVQQRAWEIAVIVEEIGSGGRECWQREALMRAARRRDIDAIVVWRLDRWGTIPGRTPVRPTCAACSRGVIRRRRPRA